MSEARAATAADRAAIAQTLARAFFHDPVVLHLMPDAARRRAKLPRLFALFLKLALPYGGCDVSPGYEAAAFWRPPGKWHMPFWQYLVHGAALLDIFGGDVLRALQAAEAIEQAHPRPPHWYLQTIGTDPAAQGKGFGGRLMRRRLALVDEAHAPAYLESSKAANIPIYQSFGFEVTGEIAIRGGPTLYAMWRAPRP